ncbi:MAG: hypothetical protein ACI8ZX_002120 [Planctomycetota bacterium]|jgi:hypothetical protein
MKKILLAFSFLFINLFSFGQPTLSNSAEISLLTCEKGYELYSAYGHSCIRVQDVENDIDVVFNYGTFQIGDNELVFLKTFVQGTLDYTLSTSQYARFLRTYQNENRGITEQIFNLTLAEKQAVFNRLIVNYETDERYYRYDFFFDNCSSRIHEILKEVLGKELIYGDDLIDNSPETFRELIAPAFDFSPWADFGVGIIMGYPTDRTATNKEKMFLPVHLMDRFDLSTYKGESFVKSKEVLFATIPPTINNPFYKKPIFIFTIIFLLVALISFVNFKKNKHYYSIDYFLFFFTGFIGVFFLFMWFGTRHSPTFMNMNMFWAMPLNLIALFFLKTKKIAPYLIFMGILNVLGFFILPEVFHIAIIPILLMMATRYFKLYLFRKSKLV